MFWGLISSTRRERHSKITYGGEFVQVLTCVDDVAHIVQVRERQQEVPGYFFHQRHWYSQFWEEAPIAIHAGARSFEDRTGMFTVWTVVLKLVEKR